MATTWTGNGRGTAVLLHGMMSLAGTWWQIGPALAERGWDVTALDLAGHGGHRLDGPLTADALVESVTAQVSGPVDLLVGHSMGAATAISTVVRRPGLARAVVLEDPPGGMARGNEELAHGVELDAHIARTDRERLVRRSRADHPDWAADDVENDVRGVEQADAVAVAAGLRAGLRGWDMPALVAAAVTGPRPAVSRPGPAVSGPGPAVSGPGPAGGAAGLPVLVLAATESGSALTGAARAGVRTALPADRFVELPGGHCLHRDLPGQWLAAVEAAVDAFTG